MMVSDVPVSQAFQSKLKSPLSFGKVDPANYGAVYLAGGHGAMWVCAFSFRQKLCFLFSLRDIIIIIIASQDFPYSMALQRVVAEIWESGKCVLAACHGMCSWFPFEGEEWKCSWSISMKEELCLFVQRWA